MARAKANGRRKRARRGQSAVPRGPGGCVVRRAYSFGNVPYPGAADAGIQVGINPTAVLDWSSFSATWQRFRILSATVHFVQSGQNDATPGFSTVYAFHDAVSSGAPATILDALVRKGRKILSFGSSKMHHQFTFRPLPWTSTGFGMTVARPEVSWLPVGGANSFTSMAAWLQNYNSTTSSPVLNITVELVIHFDSPQ